MDYNIGNSQNGSGDENLAAALGIPESCDIRIDVGDSGLTGITVVDNEIEVPQTDSLSIQSFARQNIDQTYKQNLAETLLEKEKGIYVYEGQIKSEIEAEIAYYKNERAGALDNGESEDTLLWYDSQIRFLETELELAPDAYKPAGDYTEERFLGSRNGMEYVLRLAQSDGGIFMKDSNIIHYRPYEGAASGIISEDEPYFAGYEGETGENLCEIFEEQAAIAAEFLDTCGITGLDSKKITELWWYYQNPAGDIIALERDGYVVTFERQIDHAPVFSGNLDWVDNIVHDGTRIQNPGETASVLVDDNGVLEASWGVTYLPDGKEEEAAALLSWEELLEAANTNIADYYTRYPTQNYEEIEFNEVSLCYYMVAEKGSQNGFQCIPVWVFAQNDKMEEDSPAEYLIQLVVINAMDGTVIDLTETKE